MGTGEGVKVVTISPSPSFTVCKFTYFLYGLKELVEIITNLFLPWNHHALSEPCFIRVNLHNDLWIKQEMEEDTRNSNLEKKRNKNVTCACMCLVDSAPATAASDERRKAVQGSSPAFSLCSWK